MVEGCLESPSEVRAESDHHPSSLVPPSNRRGPGALDVDVVDTRWPVGVGEGLQGLLVRGHRIRLS